MGEMRPPTVGTILVRFAADIRKLLKFEQLALVEAAGVEPASENVTGQEPTYVVAFTRRELPRHIRFLRLEPTRNASR